MHHLARGYMQYTMIYIRDFLLPVLPLLGCNNDQACYDSPYIGSTLVLHLLKQLFFRKHGSDYV